MSNPAKFTLCYIFRKWEHFQITAFNWVYMTGGKPCPPATFSELLPNFIFQCYRPQTWQFYLFFPALSISSICKVPSIIFKGEKVTRSILLQKAYCPPSYTPVIALLYSEDQTKPFTGVSFLLNVDPYLQFSFRSKYHRAGISIILLQK